MFSTFVIARLASERERGGEGAGGGGDRKGGERRREIVEGEIIIGLCLPRSCFPRLLEVWWWRIVEKTWIASFIFVTTLYRARQRDRRGNREGEGEGGGERSVVERGWGGGANGEDLDCLVHFCHNTVSC